MKKILLATYCFIVPFISSAQILNLDRTVTVDTTTKKKYAAVLGASFSSFHQTYSFIDEGLYYDLTFYMPKKHILVLSGKNNVTSTGGTIIQNQGYIHLRYRDNDTKKLSLEPFAQYQWNTTIGLEQRYLGGCNLRVRILKKKKADIYYGLGGMYEGERWNYHGVTDTSLLYLYYYPAVEAHYFKSSQYLKASIAISESADLVTAVFLQNRINDPVNSYRLSNYTTLSLRIAKKIYFAISSDISYDNNPVVPIKQTLYSISSSLSARF